MNIIHKTEVYRYITHWSAAVRRIAKAARQTAKFGGGYGKICRRYRRALAAELTSLEGYGAGGGAAEKFNIR